MIHLGYRIRRQRGRKKADWSTWSGALAELWRPILSSMVIVVSGFALFLFSSFPPTQRLGILVCAGAAITDIVVLIVLPAVATWSWRDAVDRVALLWRTPARGAETLTAPRRLWRTGSD